VENTVYRSGYRPLPISCTDRIYRFANLTPGAQVSHLGRLFPVMLRNTCAPQRVWTGGSRSGPSACARSLRARACVRARRHRPPTSLLTHPPCPPSVPPSPPTPHVVAHAPTPPPRVCARRHRPPTSLLTHPPPLPYTALEPHYPSPTPPLSHPPFDLFVFSDILLVWYVIPSLLSLFPIV